MNCENALISTFFIRRSSFVIPRVSHFALTPLRSGAVMSAAMKSAPHSLRFLTFLTVAAFVLCLAVGGSAQQAPLGENFPGVKKVLTSEQYAEAGLNKLSAEERAKLDDYLRGYVNSTTQRVAEQAASRAVDTAVKERRVEPPQLIESKIVGKVNGWKVDKIFILENGQHWKVVENGDRYFAAVENPDVFIVRDSFGYKMAIAGGGTVRVKRLQ